MLFVKIVFRIGARGNPKCVLYNAKTLHTIKSIGLPFRTSKAKCSVATIKNANN